MMWVLDHIPYFFGFYYLIHLMLLDKCTLYSFLLIFPLHITLRYRAYEDNNNAPHSLS